MNKKQIELRDPVVERVVDKFVSRSDVGYKKYGITLDSDPSEVITWLNHLQALRLFLGLIIGLIPVLIIRLLITGLSGAVMH